MWLDGGSGGVFECVIPGNGHRASQAPLHPGVLPTALRPQVSHTEGRESRESLWSCQQSSASRSCRLHHHDWFLFSAGRRTCRQGGRKKKGAGSFVVVKREEEGKAEMKENGERHGFGCGCETSRDERKKKTFWFSQMLILGAVDTFLFACLYSKWSCGVIPRGTARGRVWGNDQNKKTTFCI